ncbi:hypothetical protein CFP56_031043 [Quercus suber]|uniref:Secreted protein n=1 Tax=Quercus suber TaxID=58331 RepID=A0AAW0LVL1_QUESU
MIEVVKALLLLLLLFSETVTHSLPLFSVVSASFSLSRSKELHIIINRTILRYCSKAGLPQSIDQLSRPVEPHMHSEKVEMHVEAVLVLRCCLARVFVTSRCGEASLGNLSLGRESGWSS